MHPVYTAKIICNVNWVRKGSASRNRRAISEILSSYYLIMYKIIAAIIIRVPTMLITRSIIIVISGIIIIKEV